MIEDRIAKVLHNFYESCPYMTYYKLAEILGELNIIKGEAYNRAKETLTKYNLPTMTLREDLVNRSELSSNQIRELNEVLFDREYIKELVSHIQKLLGMRYTNNKVAEVIFSKETASQG